MFLYSKSVCRLFFLTWTWGIKLFQWKGSFRVNKSKNSLKASKIRHASELQ